jgi:hypothetical protein
MVTSLMKVSPRRVGFLAATTYVAVWSLSAYAYFAMKSFDAMFALFLVSMPSSYFVDELVHVLRTSLWLPEQLEIPAQYFGMLMLGAFQYFALGVILFVGLRRTSLWFSDPSRNVSSK